MVAQSRLSMARSVSAHQCVEQAFPPEKRGPLHETMKLAGDESGISLIDWRCSKTETRLSPIRR